MIGSARLGSALLSRATRAALTTPRLFPPCPAGHARALTSTLSVADRARQAAVQRANARRRAANTSPSSPSKPLPPSLSLARGAPPAVTLRAAPGSLQPTTAVVPAARRSGRDLVLSPPALVVTREFEFGNILFGFEQANKYTIRAAPGGHVVGFIAEEDGLGKSVVRQVMKTHRKFTATVFDSAGSPVFELRRPAFLVSSNMYVHEPGPGGALLGHVEMAWHLWRRRYRLYTGGAQFAECDAGFLGIDFEMKNEGGGAVARVNKDFTGFAREMFTDARQYVIRLDPAYNMTGEGFDNVHATTLAAGQATGGDGGKDEVGLRERAVLVASAIGIDFDYFSVHSRGPGLMPFAMAGGGGGGGGAGGAAGGAAGSVGGAAGAEAAGGAMGGMVSDDGGGDDAGEFGATSGGGFDAPPADAGGSEQSEWATFEEPDLGFQDDPSGDDGDGWGSGFADNGMSDSGSADVGDEGGLVSSIFETVKGIFWDD